MANLHTDFRTSVRLFSNNLLTQCKYVLENLNKDARESGTLLEQLFIEQNYALCDLLCDGKKGTNAEEKYSSVCELLLQRVYNSSEKMEILEIVLNYNFLSWELLRNISQDCSRSKVKILWKQLLNRFGLSNEKDPEELKLIIFQIFQKLEDSCGTKYLFKCICCHIIIILLMEACSKDAKILIDIISEVYFENETLSFEQFFCTKIKNFQNEVKGEKHLKITRLSQDYFALCCVIYHIIITKNEARLRVHLNTLASSEEFQWLAKYIGAISKYNQDPNLLMCVEDLQTYLENSTVSNPFLHALFQNLLGCYFSRLNKPHLAIQRFSAALSADDRCLIALYNISVQYNKMNVFNGEIEALQLLANQIQSYPNLQNYLRSIDCNIVIESTIKILHPMEIIPYSQVCYLLARRALEQKRFSDSASNYLDLISTVIKSLQLTNPSTCLPAVPSIKTIYHEAAYALLMCERYQDAFILCEEAIGSHVQTEVPNEALKPDEKHLELECLRYFSEDILALMLKFYLYFQVGEITKTLLIIHHVLTLLSQEKRNFSHGSQNVDGLHSYPKRSRMETENENINCDDSVSRTINRLKGFAYKCKAMILLQRNDFQDALHNLHISILSDPENTESRYNYTLLLIKLDRQKEGFGSWISFRKTCEKKMQEPQIYAALDIIGKQYIESEKEVFS